MCGRRIEPGPVHPAAEGVDAALVGVEGVLRRHVDMRHPQVAGGRRDDAAPSAALAPPVPQGVGEADCRRHARRRSVERVVSRGGVDKGAVLDDQRNLIGRDDVAVDQVAFPLVGDHVAGGHAGQHVEAGDAEGVVVVEEQTRGLLVAVVEGHGAVARIGHVGHVGDADALGIGRWSRRPG